MKICIFSDIHGNGEALDMMLSDVTGQVDAYIFAGDIWGYFYDQEHVIDSLMSLPELVAVKGNHDEYYLRHDFTPDLLDRYGSSYLTPLYENRRSFIEKLPDHLTFEIDGRKFGIYHGGLSDSLEQRIYPDTEIEKNDQVERFDYLILGHTHYRMCKRIVRTTVINPGSLGQPRDGQGFSYCILNTETDGIDFRTVTIDISKLLEHVAQTDGDKSVCTYLKGKYMNP